MTWLMQIITIYLEHALMKHYAIKHLIFSKNPKYDRYQKILASMANRIINKKLLVVLLKMKVCKTKNYQNIYANKLLEKLNEKKYTHLL